LLGGHLGALGPLGLQPQLTARRLYVVPFLAAQSGNGSVAAQNA
jgi:hypothetical protein